MQGAENINDAAIAQEIDTRPLPRTPSRHLKYKWWREAQVEMYWEVVSLLREMEEMA